MWPLWCELVCWIWLAACYMDGVSFDAGLTVLGFMVDFYSDTIFWKWRTSWLPVNFVIHVLFLKKSSKTILIQKNSYVTPTAIVILPPVHVTKPPSQMGLIVYLMTFFLIFFTLLSALAEFESLKCAEIDKEVIRYAWRSCRWDGYLADWVKHRSDGAVFLHKHYKLQLVLNLDQVGKYQFFHL